MDSNFDMLLQNTNKESQIIVLGRKIGAKNLATVLDTLSDGISGEVYITPAQALFDKLKREARDKDVFSRYNRANRRELALEYDVSERRIDQIVEEQAALLESA